MNLNCPARERKYLCCNNIGHFSRCCKTKKIASENSLEKGKSKIWQLGNRENHITVFLFCLLPKNPKNDVKETVGEIEIDMIVSG